MPTPKRIERWRERRRQRRSERHKAYAEGRRAGQRGLNDPPPSGFEGGAGRAGGQM